VTTSEAAAALQTNRHGRAALGIAAANLRRGYDVIDDIEPSLGTELLAPLIGLVESLTDRDVRDQARDLLDRSNAYAQGLYATLPDDDGPIAPDRRAMVSTALEQAERNLRILEAVRADLVTTFLEDLGELVDAIFEATVKATKFIADKAKQIVASVVPPAVWWVLGGALIVGAGVYAWRLSK
jgi:hypothetical protein